MSYKSLNEVESVIALGKPIEVVDMLLESYLQGLEYDKWAEGKDLTETVEVVVWNEDNTESTVTEELVNVYVPIDVSDKVVQWKLQNYAKLREAEYPSWKEFADAYVKNDEVGMQAYKDKCIAVKAKYPK